MSKVNTLNGWLAKNIANGAMTVETTVTDDDLCNSTTTEMIIKNPKAPNMGMIQCIVVSRHKGPGRRQSEFISAQRIYGWGTVAKLSNIRKVAISADILAGAL